MPNLLAPFSERNHSRLDTHRLICTKFVSDRLRTRKVRTHLKLSSIELVRTPRELIVVDLATDLHLARVDPAPKGISGRPAASEERKLTP